MVPTTSRRYRPDPIISYWGAKPRGGRRKFAILTPQDECTWHGIAGRVATLLEPRLDSRVAANRAVNAPSGWRLEGTGTALLRARGVAPGHGLLLRTDVEEFYASVTPPVLARTLVGLGSTPEDARLVAEMLEGWAGCGYEGLPVGPVGSAVMANAVLMSVDEALTPLQFIRWADDYVIAVSSERAANMALDRLDTSLALLGLRRSVPKTQVLEGAHGIAWLRSGVPDSR